MIVVKVGLSGVGFKALIPQKEQGGVNFILIVDYCAGDGLWVTFCFSISYTLTTLEVGISCFSNVSQ